MTFMPWHIGGDGGFVNIVCETADSGPRDRLVVWLVNVILVSELAYLRSGHKCYKLQKFCTSISLMYQWPNIWSTFFHIDAKSLKDHNIINALEELLQHTYDDNFHHGRESLTRRMATHVFNASLHNPRNQITLRYLPDIFHYSLYLKRWYSFNLLIYRKLCSR